jgi:flagellar hook protein FlgE
MTVNYTKTGTNQWSYTIDVPTADTGAATTQVASGNLTFDSSGNLTAPAAAPTFTIPSFVDGAATMNLTWNLKNSDGTSSVTQTALDSSNGSATQNGQKSGTLTEIAVSSDGTVNGTYSNGQINVLGQVAVASFTNNQGLLRIGNNEYQATAGSGVAGIGTAGTGGRGTITGDSVESSNVDVAAEFAKMIVAQQAYSANAKTVTTFDQVSQATIAMVQG